MATLNRRLFYQIRKQVSAEQEPCDRARVLAEALKQADIAIVHLARYAHNNHLDFSVRGSSPDLPAIAEAFLYEAASSELEQHQVTGELAKHGLR